MTDELNLGEYAEHPEIAGKIPTDGTAAQWLAKRVVDSQSEISRRLRVPSPDAGDEDRAAFIERLRSAVPGVAVIPGEDDADGWAAFRKQLGAPDDPSGYEPPNETSKDLLEMLGPVAHGSGITNAQLKPVLAKLDELRGGASEALNQKSAETTEALKAKWGDAYPQKMIHAKLLATQRGFDDLLADKTVGSNQALLEYFAEQGAQLAENEHITTDMATSAGIMTMPEAEARRTEIYNNKAYRDPMHPDYDGLVREALKLNTYIARQKARA